jgi:hypothetical protein
MVLPQNQWFPRGRLEDMRDTQLVNAMKNMDVSNIRPREMIEAEDDKDQVLSNSNV